MLTLKADRMSSPGLGFVFRMISLCLLVCSTVAGRPEHSIRNPRGQRFHHSHSRIYANKNNLYSSIERYEERHRDAITNPKSKARYIITYETDGGALGNSFPGILSAFFLALLTNRVLLLEDFRALTYLKLSDMDLSYSEQVRNHLGNSSTFLA